MHIHLIETGRHQALHVGSTAWSAGVHVALVASITVSAWLSHATTREQDDTQQPEKEVVYLLPNLPTAPAVGAYDDRKPTQSTDAGGRQAQRNGTLASGNTARDGDALSEPATAALAAIDSLARLGSMIFRVSSIDQPAERDPGSAAPAYPAELQRARIEGDVAAEWIVDSNGRADTSTFRVVSATHPQFADAVRAALPLMHFRPAETLGRRVAQMVRQQFNFRMIIPDGLRDTSRDSSNVDQSRSRFQ